jgi:hypothetical protein
MHEIALVLLFFLIILFFLYSKKENYSYAPFSAHFFPSVKRNADKYEQLSLLPYSVPPTGPYSLGWDTLQNLKHEYPSQIKLYKLMHPS